MLYEVITIEKLEAQAEVASRYKQHQSELQHKQQLLWFLRRRDASAEQARHAQVVGDEQIGDAEPLLQVDQQVEVV